MATLQSPGVQVQIINESFYTPAAPGTVPLMFVASASDKTNPSGTTAVGTTAANAGKVYLVTSQRDLVDTFGTPLFYTDAGGNPIHGGELNEYGLQAAYSLLGVSSAAYVVRAPIDLASLVAQASAPAGAPTDGSYWVDTDASSYGVFEWNKSTNAFTNKVPAVIDDSNANIKYDGTLPVADEYAAGQYVIAVNQESDSSNGAEVITVFLKNSDGNMVEVGSRGETAFASTGSNSTFISTTWSTSFPAATGRAFTAISTGSSQTLTINGIGVSVSNTDTPADIALAINSAAGMFTTKGVGAKVVGGAIALYVDAAKSESVIISGTGNILSQIGITAGTYNAPTVFVGPHTQYPNFANEPSGSVYIKTTTPNAGASWTVKQWSAQSNAFNTVRAPIYADTAAATYNLDKTGGGANIPVGTLFIESNFTHGDDSTSTSAVLANFRILRRAAVAPTTVVSAATTASSVGAGGNLTIEISAPGANGYAASATLSISSTATNARLELREKINGSALAPLGLSATLNSDGSLGISHATGGEIRFTDPNGVLADADITTASANFYELNSTLEPTGATHLASNWAPLTFTASATAPSTTPANGQLWYSSIIDQVDIMVHDGSDWRGYREIYPNTDPEGPIVSATRPTLQSDGTALANGDIWISTADLERYGQDVYVYDGNTLSWVVQDVADQTSPTGWLFADARFADAGSKAGASTIKELLVSSYVDPDAPDPAEYPRGMRLWNLRRSGFNVKRFVTGYININSNNGINLRTGDPMDGSNNTIPYVSDRWVSVSPNNADGSGTFGRKAQRSFVVAAFKSVMDSNQSIRDTDTLTFNLIATPGYPELIQNMVSLNVDRGLTAFVVGDTSMRLQPTGTALQAYGLNTNGAFDNGDTGLVSYNEYMAVFYPSGFTNDLAGNNIVVPPSHMMLRTIALSDQRSFPWFAPAGIRRGVVDNATSVGYLQDGEFRTTALPQNVRDVMAAVKINPIATITGAGIINFGQYTRANAASALDRINVARLVAYLRRQLDVLARPFLFEPNDKVTRNEIRNAVQGLLLELVGQRALYDFIVVCDESNNTPARIDRSELWVDVAIEPVKAVEFIYIPVRLVNTGEIQAGTFTIA